jgi:hypothetical protein
MWVVIFVFGIMFMLLIMDMLYGGRLVGWV